MPINTNEAFVENLRQYPNEKYPKKKKDWQSVQGGSILTICKLHPSMRPPMVRPGDDNELGAQDVEEFIKNLVEKGQPVVKTEGLGKGLSRRASRSCSARPRASTRTTLTASGSSTDRCSVCEER